MADPPRHPDSNSDIGDYPGTPRWVKVFGVVVILLVLLVAVIMFTGVGGEHGPGRHMPSGDVADTPSADPGSHTPPVDHGVQRP